MRKDGTLSGEVIPAGERRKWAPYLVFGLCLLVYLYPFMRMVLLNGDEGTFLSGAVRVTEGQVPFRDFFEVPGPGSFYWLALFFKLLGTTFLTARLSLALTTLGTALLMYFLARRLGTRYSAMPAVFSLATSFGRLWPAISHHHDSDLFALLAFTALLSWIDTRRLLLLFAAGLLAGVTTCFTQPKGVFLFISFAVLVLVLGGKARLLSSLGWLTGGYLAVGITVVFLYWRAGALHDLIYANVIWPLTQYDAVNKVPYAHEILTLYGGSWVSALSPAVSPVVAFAIASFLMLPLFLVAALPVIAVLAALRYKGAAFNRSTWPYWAAGSALWLSEIHRKDITHLVSGSLLLMIPVFYLLGRERQRFNLQCAQLICLSTFGLAIFNLFITLAAHRVETARGAVYTFESDPVLEFLNAHVQPGQEIFVYPYCPIYYFLSGARNPTRYSILMYGINTDSQFREAVNSLEAKKIRYVIWDREFNDKGALLAWPAYSVPPKERLIMEPYLGTHYQLLERMKRFDILERKPEPIQFSSELTGDAEILIYKLLRPLSREPGL
ncbi:MAG: ArnT family glycosyltransferase [Bryobacteraceae bacterium]